MRRFLHLAMTLAVLLSLFVWFRPEPVFAQESATPSAETIFADPAGRFSFPVPTNWTVKERAEYVLVLDPDEKLNIAVLVVEAPDARTGAEAAWAIVKPEFDSQNPAIEDQALPSAQGVDETRVLTLVNQTTGQVDQAYAQRVGESVYVLIFSGSLDAATRRQSQVNVIATGFTIKELTVTDLSEASPIEFKGDLVGTFEAFVEDLLQRTQVPGAAIAIVQDGAVVYARGSGVKEVGGSEPVTPDTLMIGSTTKSMTTMMMATEVDDGLMRWDQPVVEILPSFEVADEELSKKITVRNLVCACTGLPRRDLEWLFNANDLTAEQIVESLGGFEFFTEFGEAFQYSNQMVATSGYVAALAAGGQYGRLGQAYSDELENRVLDPIGMKRTTLSFEVVRADDDHATPHGATLDLDFEPLALEVEESLVPVAPAGALWSTANDIARYVITELNRGIGPDGNRVVSAANLEETWQPQIAVDANSDYGLGWMVGEFKGVRLIAHGGNTFGFTSDLAFLPEAGIGIAVLTNAQGSNLFNEGVRTRFLELLYDQPDEISAQIDFGLEQTKQAYNDLTATLAATLDETTISPYLGRYENDALGEIELLVDDERLYLDAGEFRTELRQTSNSIPGATRFITFNAPIIGLPVDVRTATGGKSEIVIDITTDQYVFTRASAAVATPEPSPVT